FYAVYHHHYSQADNRGDKMPDAPSPHSATSTFWHYRNTEMTQSRPEWPYPALIAHRGAGRHAPENTLAAFRLGAHHGFMMMEYDVKLSRDGVALLLHDDTLDRTSNTQGNAADHTWAELAAVDAGSWHSAEYAGE